MYQKHTLLKGLAKDGFMPPFFIEKICCTVKVISLCKLRSCNLDTQKLYGVKHRNELQVANFYVLHAKIAVSYKNCTLTDFRK